MPDIAGLEETPHRTYHDIFDLAHLPASLIVVGGGPLGMELAQAFQRLGSQVTMLAPRLLPHDDPEAGAVLQRVFEREGVRWLRGRAMAVSARVRTESSCRRMLEARRAPRRSWWRPDVGPTSRDLASIVPASPTPIEASPSTTDCARTSRTSTRPATSWDGEQFSHVAGWQAFEATRNALLPGSSSGRVNPMAWVTFTDPEVAQVGLSETAAREQLGDDDDRHQVGHRPRRSRQV